MEEAGRVRAPVVPVAELYPAFACCCAMSSCYCTYPDCLGIYSQQVFACCHAEQILCKPLKEKSFCWTSSKVECLCRKVATCSRLDFQACCIDLRCGIPRSVQHPWMCTFLFCTIYSDGDCRGECCQPVSRLVAAHAIHQPLVEEQTRPSAPSASFDNTVHIDFNAPLAIASVVSDSRPDIPQAPIIARLQPQSTY